MRGSQSLQAADVARRNPDVPAAGRAVPDKLWVLVGQCWIDWACHHEDVRIRNHYAAVLQVPVQRYSPANRGLSVPVVGCMRL